MGKPDRTTRPSMLTFRHTTRRSTSWWNPSIYPSTRHVDEEVLVKVHSGAGRTYHPRDFKLRTEPIDAGPNRWHQYHVRSASSGHSDESRSTGSQSQSERDWAYAKR